jgi:hypothetical protein
VLNNSTIPAFASSCKQTSKTDNVKLQVAVLAELSVAVQLTVVVPNGKQLPDAGMQTCEVNGPRKSEPKSAVFPAMIVVLALSTKKGRLAKQAFEVLFTAETPRTPSFAEPMKNSARPTVFSASLR